MYLVILHLLVHSNESIADFGAGFTNPETYFRNVLEHNDIELVPNYLKMCGLARESRVECKFGREAKENITCKHPDRYSIDVWAWKNGLDKVWR